MAAVVEMKGRIRGKLRKWKKQEENIAEMCLSIDISDWKKRQGF